MKVLVYIEIALFAYTIGNITFVDYFGAGVLTVLLFYVLRQRTLWSLLLQLLGLYYINGELLAGMCFPIEIGGKVFEFPEQGLAVLAILSRILDIEKGGQISRSVLPFKYSHIIRPDDNNLRNLQALQ